MLRDPELQEAYQAIQEFPSTDITAEELADHLNELTSVTMTLLRVVDHMQESYLADVNLLNATLQDNARQIQEALSKLRRN